MGVLCWGVYVCCGCPQASGTCAAWTGGKPSAGQSSPQPALSACPHPINVALAHVLILVLGTVSGHSAAP